jgi:HEAT repeat protein
MRCLSLGAGIALLMLGPLTTLHAQRAGVPLNDYRRLGQRFTVTRPFHTLWVIIPSWLDAEGGLTLTLWDSPQRNRQLARRAFTAIGDNARVELPLPRPMPAGSYYWEAGERTGQTRVGLYAEPVETETGDCAYLDGAPDRKRRFVFGTIQAAFSRADAPRLIAMLKSGSAQEKADACRQLAVVGTPESVPALARLLGDEKLSHMARFALEPMPYPTVDAAFQIALRTLKGRALVGVINSIAVRRDAKAAGPLSALLRNPDPEVAAAAAVALGRIGTLAAAGTLEKALGGAPPGLRPAVYEGCLNCAHALAARGRRDRAAALYDRLRTAQMPKAIQVAALRGAIVARGTGGLPLLIRQLRGADSSMTGVALWVTQRELPGTKVTVALASELGRLPVERQPLLIQALAGRGDRAALPSLQAAATAGARTVRLSALRVLPDLGGAAAVPVLVRMLGEADAEIAQAAQDGLARLPGAEVVAAAASLLARPEAGSQLVGIDLVLRQRLPGFVPKLLEASRKTDPQVRLAALKALGELADAGELPDLLDALAAAGGAQEAEAAEQALGAVCAKAGYPDACAEKIAGRLTQSQPSLKAALLRVLGAFGSARALQAAREAIGDTDREVKAAAFEVLCEWKTPDAAPDLLKLARALSNPADRLRCLRGILRIAGDPDVPADRRLSLCKEAAGLVQRDEEKKLLLGALGGIASPEALALVMPYLDNAATKEEASAAVLGIAEKLVDGPDAAQAIAALEKVVQSASNPDHVKRARALLAQARTKT